MPSDGKNQEAEALKTGRATSLTPAGRFAILSARRISSLPSIKMLHLMDIPIMDIGAVLLLNTQL